MTAMILSATDPGRFDYPAPQKSDVVEDHFGHKIADPYRWLEDPNSADTQAWVAAKTSSPSTTWRRFPSARRFTSG